MKTKELIRRLQEQDPSGELECVVVDDNIYFCMDVFVSKPDMLVIYGEEGHADVTVPETRAERVACIDSFTQPTEEQT